MGYPFFNPPYTQKVNVIEQGQYFVATEGIEQESVEEDIGLRRYKPRRLVKIGLVVFGVAALTAFAWWFFASVL